MVANGHRENETTSGEKGAQEIEIRPGNRKNIYGKPFVPRVQKIVRKPEFELGRGRVPQLIKEIVQYLVQLAQAREFGVYQTIELCQPVMPVILWGDHQGLNEVGDLLKPAKGIPPRGGFFGVGRDCQSEKGQDNQDQGKPFFRVLHHLRLRFSVPEPEGLFGWNPWAE